MTSRKKSIDQTEKTKGRVKVDKLRLNKETVKDLSAEEKNRIKGGAAPDSNRVSCVGWTIVTCIFCR